MHIDIVVPALFWPDPGEPGVYHQLRLPALEKILEKSRCSEYATTSIEAWLCQFFKIEKQQDWPVAPIMVEMDSRNTSRACDDGYWLRADPVHLRIENNHILLVDGQMLNISPKEAGDLADNINELLTEEGLTLLPLRPHRWYVHSGEVPVMQTRLLSEVAGKNINNQLPVGDGSLVWVRRVNEIQMLLHEHPINQRREMHGEPIINSLWIWGGGVMPQNLMAAPCEIWSNHDFTQGLANAAGMKCQSPPSNAYDWLSSAQDKKQLIMLDNLWNSVCYRDFTAWRNELTKLESAWFSPLLDLLKKRRIAKLTITALGERSVKVFSLTPNSLWKLWTVNQSIAKHS